MSTNYFFRMKILQKLELAGIAAVIALCFTACPYYEYESYAPIVISRAALEASVKRVEPKELSDAGKMWVRTSQIFICERYKGVHIIDNSDPRHPVTTDFVEVPGCLDIAVNGNVLYVDNATDLVAIDIDATREIQEISRFENAFSKITAPDGMVYNAKMGKDSVVVGFKKQLSTNSSY